VRLRRVVPARPLRWAPRMVRISPNGQTSSAFIVEGQLVGPWVDELQRITLGAGSVEKIRFDLRDVSFADSAGIALLRKLRGAGAELHGCSEFLTALLGGEDRAG
jgi:hypothetical protein